MIYKAAKENDIDSVKRLQSLLLGSKYLAVRQVTQLNVLKKTARVLG